MNISPWRYFFWDLPLWAIGFKGTKRWERLKTHLESDASTFKGGLQVLHSYQQKECDENALNEAATKAIYVRVERDSDAYGCLLSRRLLTSFKVTGIEHLNNAIAQSRPIILLTGHVGSFYTIAVALAQLGHDVDPLARSVERAKHNPLPQQWFGRLNYFLTERKMTGRYVYTDYANKLDRRLIRTCRSNGILLVLPDLPRTLFPSGRKAVSFLGQSSSLPARTIEMGLKYKALFLTVWNTVELEKEGGIKRHLQIEPVFPDEQSIDKVLDIYTNRLSSIVYREPWQWMGTSIVEQFNENDRDVIP